MNFEGKDADGSSSLAMRREALASTTISTPRIPVISNVDAQPHSDPEVIKDILARQVLSKQPKLYAS